MLHIAMDVKRVQYRTPITGGGRGQGYGKKGAVCKYWLQGRCNRNPCKFVHGEVPKSMKYTYQRTMHAHYQTSKQLSHGGRPNSKRSSVGTTNKGDGTLIKNPDHEPKQSSSLTSQEDGTEENGTAKHSHGNSDPEHQDSSFLTSRGDAISQKDAQQSLILDTCNDGDKCQCLNSWFMGEGVSRLAQLEGHEKAVTGIALPFGSDKLYTGNGDGVVRVWDCHTGQFVDGLDLGSEIGCLISDDSWIFVGMRNLVKAWNIQTATEYSLDGPVGQVYALETTGIDMLFAGMQDGGILVWKYNPETNSFQLITNLKGHTCDVLSLKVGRQSLYSGSKDNTIRKWDLDTLQCAQTLTGHSAAVMSLLCWENCLLSCSLDQTIKAWAYTKDGCLEVIHTHNEEHGVLALFGMHDADNKPILFCSCNDNSVHLYELPGFTERGKIFAKQGVWAIESGPGGLFFTGDGAGRVAVWKWLHKQIAEADCTE